MRLAAELLLLLGLLLLTLHITVLRGSGAADRPDGAAAANQPGPAAGECAAGRGRAWRPGPQGWVLTSHLREAGRRVPAPQRTAVWAVVWPGPVSSLDGAG